MLKNNITTIHLLGFPGLHHFKFLFFIFLILCYCFILFGNSLIITLVSINKNLQSPMYIFLTQLSLLDILLSTDILPNMIHITIHEGDVISLTSCIIQFCFFSSLECSECLLLTIMSYDRYVAICNPLHYQSVINELFCLISIVSTWMIGNAILLLNALSICRLHFCGANFIDHFFCKRGQV
uniref:G-protein coupled receptors family 1 profile domain-containing protein n=1 Tax=Pyxicephalus adspersus TaxID=30357 RepID=A0AAV3AQ82_PYXAD|nr:TPA: hypothetical protein GDO54_005738 [Pyxicephalus adspersus]